MEQPASPKKKLKSPVIDPIANINIKTSVTCANVPEGLFDATAAKKHFSKFGRVQKIRLFPKKQMCIIEYDQPVSAERAVLNAGAFDGFMFDVTRTKARTRRRSKKEEDPDWVPDSDVEAELSAMGATPIYRVSRQKPMDVESPEVNKLKLVKKPSKQVYAKPRLPVRTKPPTRTSSAQPSTSGRESPVVVPTVQTTMTTAEAAAELHQLRSRVSSTPDEQWRTLDARDRILRAWGGAGSRVKVGGATIGTCPDMCPEKELLHRQAEHQVMTLETVPGSDGELEPWRAVKQYSRSSADQEIPMCYELRPPRVLVRTCAYLLHDIADTKRQVTLADWFHFMWDRLRGIRKDIAQQALCCADSIYLMEMCARFHAHCAARLADLEHTQFDQKLNTDNLTKCLQTLKHMYTDVTFDLKPNEPEFRGYIALLNLGDSNFWWEIQQLPLQIQKSKPIVFAIKIFNALDNNNYVRFFRLIKEEATYLQACILLRYFNDVRARALARIVKAYAPRGGSRFPVDDLMKTLHFESVESMRSFITHYGLRFGKDESELCVILDRNQFIEDSDPYPIARAIKLIESKRKCSVGEVIAGGPLPNYDYSHQTLYSSFVNGVLKESALTAEDQGYNTKNDSNKDVQFLKQEIKRLAQTGRVYVAPEATETKTNLFVKPDTRNLSPGKSSIISTKIFTSSSKNTDINKSFSFKPAIPVAPTEIIKISPEKIFGVDTKNIFSFSKPQNSVISSNLFAEKDVKNFPKANSGSGLFTSKVPQDNLFGKVTNERKDQLQNSNLFKKPNETNIFKKSDTGDSLLSQTPVENSDINRNLFTSQNVFSSSNIFAKGKEESSNDNKKSTDIFVKTVNAQDITDSKKPSSIFGSFSKTNVFSDANKVFTKPEDTKSIFQSNGDVSPGTLFKTANNTEGKSYSIFQSKNKVPSVADNIFNSVNVPQSSVYEFNQADDKEEQLKQQKINEERIKEELERQRQQKLKEEEERRQLELKRQEAERRKEEERKKQEELKKLEEIRKREEERKQEELRKKLEEERKAELKRKAEEERKFKERVGKESSELTEELIKEISDESVTCILKEEKDIFENLMSYAKTFTDEICAEISNEMISIEMKAEKFWTEKVMKKWFYIWRKQLLRNSKRRCLLEDTPVWLPDKTPLEEAASLRRLVENEALKNMAAIHRGYVFKGELRQWPKPEAYNIMEIIRSPLLRRMKQIGYPYDKCFFWKVTLVSPGDMKWMCRKIEIEKWLLDAFSDNKKHETSDSLIRVEKQSWNHLMDFAISISLTSPGRKKYCTEAIEGTNGILFYTTDSDHDFINTVEETLKQKHLYQVVPVTVIMPKAQDASKQMAVEQLLNTLVNKKIISAFKILLVDPQDICDSLNSTTKSALKWMAKKYPQVPPIEIDYLKSICERYLGNEIWYRLKSATDARVNFVLKDLQKLVDCYNVAVDKLTEVITNEDLFNWPSFPLEFHDYLDQSTPYPKPYEFIPTSARNSNNTSAIKDVMNKLKLPRPVLPFQPVDVVSLQSQMRKYCNQIEWFEDPEKVVCKIVAKLPDQFSDVEMPSEQFGPYFEQYDLIDFLNVLIYEKINGLANFDNRFAIYERPVLEEFRNIHWLYEVEILSKMKHKVLTYDDDFDIFIDAKRRKIALDSMEHLMLEDNDCTMVEENIKAANESISRFINSKDTIRQLEEQIDLERKKSMELENMLKSALSNV